MADNLSPPDIAAGLLADYAVISLEGPEAMAFAQAQFANDVLALAEGHWQWNAWLTPKGRVIAVFALLKWTAEQIHLLVLDHPPEELVSRLQTFVFRRKVRISLHLDWRARGSFSMPRQANGARLAATADGLEIDFGSPAFPRSIHLDAQAADLRADFQLRWDACDLQHGLPRLPAGQREQWTPQQLSLERLQAYSVKKGCYPGQEIVARTHFLGKAKRGVVLLHSATLLESGAMISDGARDIGEVICARPQEPALVLAVLPQEREARPLSVNGQAISEQALLDGLAR